MAQMQGKRYERHVKLVAERRELKAERLAEKQKSEKAKGK